MVNSKLDTSGSFIRNPFFRLIAPFFLSFLVYFLVLLVFDSVDQFEINFFRAELVLCIIISYLISEINRFLIFLLEKYLPSKDSLSKKIFVQITLSTVIIIAITSGSVAFYMKNMVGFKSFSTELIVFNSLYILFGWCLHAVYFSLVYLKKVTDIQLINERSRRKAVETKMEVSLKGLKPKLLNKCLETIIALSYKNADEADEYLGKVSDYYRGKLNIKNELLLLKEEVENAVSFLEIYKFWVNISLEFESGFNKSLVDRKIMQRTISTVIEYIIETAIFLPNTPSVITIGINAENLEIKCKAKQKLKIDKNTESEMLKLLGSYKLHSREDIQISKEAGVYFEIPLLK